MNQLTNYIKSHPVLIVFYIIVAGFFYYMRTAEPTWMNTVFICIVSICFASLEGKREGWYWWMKHVIGTHDIYWETLLGVNKIGHEHTYFTMLRSCFYGLIYLTCGLPVMIGCALMFPLFHDGLYYTERNNINPNDYKKRFTDYSTESTAIFTFKFKTRLILALIGAGLIGYTLIVK